MVKLFINMVHYCCVPQCKNNGTMREISFHLFPSDLKLKNLWITKIRRDERINKKVSSTMKVCSAHFAPSDYSTDEENKLRRLKKTAVPSVLPFNPKGNHNRNELVRVLKADALIQPRQTEAEDLNKEDLKKFTLELWHTNEDLKKKIETLHNEGYQEDQLKWYIDKLHEYNEVKDIAQQVFGRLAVIEGTTIRKVHEEFGMTDED